MIFTRKSLIIFVLASSLFVLLIMSLNYLIQWESFLKNGKVILDLFINYILPVIILVFAYYYLLSEAPVGHRGIMQGIYAHLILYALIVLLFLFSSNSITAFLKSIYEDNQIAFFKIMALLMLCYNAIFISFFWDFDDEDDNAALSIEMENNIASTLTFSFVFFLNAIIVYIKTPSSYGFWPLLILFVGNIIFVILFGLVCVLLKIAYQYILVVAKKERIKRSID